MGSFSVWHWLIVLIFFVFLLFLPIIIGLSVMGPQKSVLIRHQSSGLVKKGYVGYCWTYFFFGWLVPTFRGEIGIGIMHLILTAFTFGFFQIVMPFLYNKQFMTRQLTSGWQLSDDETAMSVARIKLGIAQSAGHRGGYRTEPTLGGN
ncbi:hypothetical protein D769_14178 [Cupriavidus sp. HMR-1]|uniref:hypothetical protein n=1 Tax=Cupriavidus TaxID=106589 RepID=UPI0002A3B7E6|nr:MULTISPECIES: hypothetical protein [Cupriavidus]EKZ98656.1 hypothetical protein D769_14178 [Cupriavidus sp. HMR-1]